MTQEIAETTETAAEARKRAPASNFLNIVRGRLPLLFVAAVRSNPVLAAMSTKDLASKLATSVGKVFDIRKGRNFGYIGADYVPTAEDVTAAKAWIDAIGAENVKGLVAQGDKALMQSLIDEYEAKGLATPEQAAAQSSLRTVTRKPKAEGEKPATSAPGEAAPQTSTASASDDLLS